MKRIEFLDEEIVARLAELIRSETDPDKLREQLEDYHTYDIARALEQCTAEERLRTYDVLGAETCAEIFPYYDEMGPELLAELAPERAAAILEKMDADEDVELLHPMDRELRRKFIQQLSPETRQEIRMLSSYTDEEIGSLMTTNYICVDQMDSVKQAMHSLIKQSGENDNISTIYVRDKNGAFCGAIDLKELILAREYTPLEDIIMASYPFLHDHDAIDESMERLKDYEEDSIPVLDDENELVGVVTVQELVEYMDEENRHAYDKLAGIAESEGDDRKEAVLTGVRRRMPWLALLLVLGMGVSGVVGVFESVVAEMAILVCFQSLILDMAGNVGTQSLAVTIRELSDGIDGPKETLALLGRETQIGFLNGALLGSGAFAVVGIYVRLVKHYPMAYSLAVSACVGLSLLLAMTVSGFMGTAIPMFFDRIKVDPAVASGPLITTVNDLAAVVTYYGIAWLMLPLLQTLA